MWILKLSGFPFPPTFLSSSPTHPPLPLNQLTQSDCLDFVLCILFSYTPLFLPSPKRGVLPKSTYLSVKLQKSTFCFSSDVNSLVFVWRLAHIVGAFQSCLIQVRNRHSLKCTLQHYRKCNLMMLNRILLFRFCFFQFGELRNERKWISLSGRKIRKRPFSFANYLQKSWFRLESPYKQTPLNYANPHAQVIISSPPVTSPHPARLFQWEHSEGKRESLAGSYFDILKILFLLFFWVLMRNGRNGLSFCTFLEKKII